MGTPATTTDVGRTDSARPQQLKRALLLEYLSVTWNVLETVVGFVAGIAAGSIALVGFALDSVAEASSASVLIWRLRSEQKHASTAEEVERKAIRMVAVAFLGLGAYVGGRAVYDLATRAEPEESATGIVLAVVSLVVMPLLAWWKRKSARELDSRSLQADAKQTTLCTYISAFLLFGLLANSLFGWWWADPVAGLAIAVIAIREGVELWRTEDFCCL
jgi:divalent metal cation (Fe/Co/Zn/Cd) transporter